MALVPLQSPPILLRPRAPKGPHFGEETTIILPAPGRLRVPEFGEDKTIIPELYFKVRCTYNVLSSCSYNLMISPMTAVILDIIGLFLHLLSRF